MHDRSGRGTDDQRFFLVQSSRGRVRRLVVDGDDRLRIRTVDVLRRERTRVLVRSGLTEGERLCTSPLETVADGMLVRAISAPLAPNEERPASGR